MNKLKQLLSNRPFEPDLETQFCAQLNDKAKPIISFVYWAGGIIITFYFVRALMLEISLPTIISRAAYLLFWGSLTYYTFYAKKKISFESSFITYSLGGILATVYFYGVLEPNGQFLVTSILLFLIGLLICQLRAKVMFVVALVAIIEPAVILFSYSGFSQENMSNVFLILIWASCCYIGAVLFENVNRKLFKFEQALTASRDREIAANKAKSDFLALMSHEIRTPLTSVIGFSELAVSIPNNPKKTNRALDTINRNSRHLLTLINDILDVSKVESEKLELELLPTSIFSIVEDARSIIMGNAINKELSINLDYEWPLPNKVAVDPTRLRQVLINLLGNAIKFTHEGGVSITVKYDQETLIFEISDTGIGMSEEQQKQLFTKFNQADSSTTREFGGSGLGLYLSQKIAQVMGGDISVKSSQGEGSCFIVTITALQDGDDWIHTSPDIERISETKKKGQLNGHVLLVDDYADNRVFIGSLLESMGLTVSLAVNGEEAVEKSLETEYDVILMDIQMPVMGGMDAMTLLKSTGCDTPIIALTANVMRHEIEKYLKAGFDACLSKPIETDAFFNTLSKYLDESIANTEHDEIEIDLTELRNNYRQTLIDILPELQTAQANTDWRTLRMIGHQIKGIAGSFGFVEIGKCAGQIESTAAKNDMDNMSDALKQIYVLIEALK